MLIIVCLDKNITDEYCANARISGHFVVLGTYTSKKTKYYVQNDVDTSE